MICAAPIQFLAGWQFDDAMIRQIDVRMIMAIAYQSLICAAFGFMTWNKLLKHYGASTLHSFVLIMPVSGVAAGGLILGEPITPTIMAAVVLVALGIGIVNLRPRRTPAAYPLGRSF